MPPSLPRFLSSLIAPILVVGVLPDAFTFPGKSPVWAPFAPDAENRTRRDLHTVQAFGRLKPGVTYEQAQAELKTLAAREAKE